MLVLWRTLFIYVIMLSRARVRAYAMGVEPDTLIGDYTRYAYTCREGPVSYVIK